MFGEHELCGACKQANLLEDDSVLCCVVFAMNDVEASDDLTSFYGRPGVSVLSSETNLTGL